MVPTESDVQQNKGMAMVAYILFFIPLLAAKESPYAQYHARQGFNLFLLALATNVVLGIIPIIGWLLLPLANIGILCLVIIGILAAANGQAKPLPLIGKYEILK
ncbi:hypothetical protein B1A99_09890 [Cohnella sp. CIP 111063]|jgi:Predicted membrane protein|uniref:DUF4870 domain-containing protein n=1 Tax=unclassified Cohnella TaxID=2636738 RepID=UPI000B8C09D7|nr:MULTISPECIES: DUF4870 domain-containing protein [unclassified Cohnella]OXS59841.1 hypothetical protein B1A99_09890 [Cohnella sp. CIP 111063]PRX72637.1 putative membrane protein [Cohnella sp. SGD-V74]